MKTSSLLKFVFTPDDINKDFLFLLLRFISLDSNNLYAYLSKGRLYQFLERNDDAIVMFLKAIDINSKFSISYYINLGSRRYCA